MVIAFGDLSWVVPLTLVALSDFPGLHVNGFTSDVGFLNSWGILWNFQEIKIEALASLVQFHNLSLSSSRCIAPTRALQWNKEA